jgi:PleD family two-component response regulator
VLSFSDSLLRPGVTQTRIGRLREQVRPTDIVGRLGEGEIGMLLHNTPGGEARAVTARLRRALQEFDDLESSVRVSVGFATREPGQPGGGALAQQAREDALRDTQESRQ